MPLRHPPGVFLLGLRPTALHCQVHSFDCRARTWREETNFCLGRVTFVRFKETDDLARRTQHLMDCQLAKQHTRLRDGTVIPFTALFLDDIIDKPGPIHIFTEQPLLKWTWDETYDEACDIQEEAKVEQIYYL